MEHFDVLIIGAGISGIGAAYHLQRDCPTRTYVILEGREALGGTWDLFRYPGIRSDSDMFTLVYSFRPWTEAKAIADGPSILKYLQGAVEDYGIGPHIRYGHKVSAAQWDSATSRWTVQASGADGGPVQFTCNFLFCCTGYYNYAAGYTPEFAGVSDYQGALVHPQHWPQDLDYAGKQVVVIGSGATAMTLVPEMAKRAAKVTMLQRSPTYVVSRPAEDALANWLRAHLPAKLAYSLVRWRNVLLQQFFFNLARKNPEKTKERLVGLVREALGPDFDVETHFTPRYKPWDQRLCLIPDDDLFNAIKAGKAEVVTDQIDAFTADGLRLASGQTLSADVVVTATGLDLQSLGGLELSVDGAPVNVAQCFSYKGMMYSDVPNLASSFGYTNASWTLKCDLTCEYVCRLLNYMDAHGYSECRPLNKDPELTPAPWLDFSSGYVQRALDRLPKQGSKAPWKLHQNYALDMLALRLSPVADQVMHFAAAPGVRPQ